MTEELAITNPRAYAKQKRLSVAVEAQAALDIKHPGKFKVTVDHDRIVIQKARVES